MIAAGAFRAVLGVVANCGRKAGAVARDRVLLGPLLVSLVSPGCAVMDCPRAANGAPMAFHDTRLQYALLTDDQAMLRTDFRISTPSSGTERAVAALVLPFTAATETVFFPISAAINGLADLGSPPPGRRLN